MKDLNFFKNLYYNIIISRETIENEVIFTAYSKELGKYSCFGTGATPQEAIDSFNEEKNFFIEFLFTEGKEIPEPVSEASETDQYSGVFNIRTSSLLHYKLVRQAKEQGLSMNMYINQLLAFAAGEKESENMLILKFNELAKKIDQHHFSVTGQVKYENLPKTESSPKFGEYLSISYSKAI